MMVFVDHAVAPQSVTLTIEDHLDISRGDMLVKPVAKFPSYEGV